MRLAWPAQPRSLIPPEVYQMRSKSLFLRFLFAAMLCFGVAVAPASANPFETTLANGLKLIVKEDHRAPTLVHMVWYRVGSMDEVDGQTGVAHALEHMMFKGTTKVGPGEFNKRVAAMGGRDNAFTNQDYTAYFQQVPRERLRDVMELEADRMANLVIDPEAFSKELQVIMEERRLRTDDQPRARAMESLHATALLAHPYRRPVIGWMEDLTHMRAEDVADWHRKWYAPNNATVVIVGDIDHEAVFRLAAQTYGVLDRRELGARRGFAEPVQGGPRHTTVRATAELPLLAMAWHVPAIDQLSTSRQGFALEVLSAILDGHDSARLNRRLVKESREALAVGASYGGISRGRNSLFVIDATPAPGISIATLETRLRAEVQRIIDEGITETELKRVKAQLVSSKVFQADSLMGQAMQIGSIEMAGYSWRDEDKIFEALRSVTAEEVRAAARLIGTDTSLTVTELEPLPSANKPAPPATTAQP